LAKWGCAWPNVAPGYASYAAENKDWLAGPETSGWQVGNGGTPRESSTAPTQNMDWMSPIFGDALGLPSDPEDRVQAIFQDEFRCPANDVTYDTATSWSGPNINDLPSNSYSAVLAFHFYNLQEAPSRKGLNNPIGSVYNNPSGYAPRIDQVGGASNKVWSSEGVRYWETNGSLSYNGFTRQLRGGNFMEYGPAVQFENGPFATNNDEGIAERGAFRHNNSLNASYFDGHASGVKPEDAKPAGGDTLESLAPWFPTGTKVGPNGSIGTIP
jgi:prepilin-type processing-associated H-X9-DG protein